MTSPHVPHDQIAASALVRDLSETVQTLFSAGDVGDTLAQVTSLAMATIDGCDFASVVLVEGDVIASPVPTTDLLTELEALQRSTGEGPGVDAVTQRTPFYVDDLDGDPRWPRFGPEATAKGMRCLFALPLAVDDILGVLNLYGRYPQAFGVLD